MKKFAYLIFILIIIISTTSCSKAITKAGESSQNDTGNSSIEQESNTAQSTNSEDNKNYSAVEVYKSVLQDKDNFFSTDDKKYIYFKDLLKNMEMPESPALEITHFTVLDMDGDKTPEVVLELSFVGGEYPFSYEILHYMNDEVYGYNVVYRGLEMLKADGTFWSSGGAADNSCNKMRFSDKGYELDVLAYSESNFNNDVTSISYFINDEPVKAESFESFTKEQDKKKDVVWYDFSQENIDTKLSDLKVQNNSTIKTNEKPENIKIKSSAKTLNDFIPHDWKLISKAEGDLNKDKLIDIGAVIEYTGEPNKNDDEDWTGQPRILFIVFMREDGTYDLSVQSSNVILRADEGGVYGDPFVGIEYSRGSIVVSSYGGSAWRWGFTDRYRFQDNEWYLIGKTELSEHIHTGESETIDTNCLTGEQIITSVDKNGKKDVIARNIGKQKLEKI